MARVGRPEHDRVVADLLATVAANPAALVVEGEPGIGKTTVWQSAIDGARARGFAVLAMRAAVAESVAAYAGLGDLLSKVDSGVFTALPVPQRQALDRVMLRGEDGPATEPRAVSAAFLSIVESLARVQPVLIAIDDLQWVDASTAFALGYVARRLPEGAGIVASHRVTGAADSAGWLQLPDLHAVTRITLQPFTFGELSELLESRVQRRLSRAEVIRISEISGGNPFYAIELGLAMSDPKSPSALPGSLAELVRARVGHLDDAARELLLGVASLAQPTVDAIAGAVGIAAARATELLEDAETAGIVEIDGNKVRFTHPLLAHGVYEQAAPAGRRAMHRRLAGVVNEPESRARHLALGATSADPETLGSLDAAATSARRRGAPRAAAELLDLAINLGGDAPERRIRSAAYHFDSGDVERANSMLEETMKVSTPGRVRATAASLLATIAMYVDGFGSGAAILERYLPEAAGDPALSVSMLMGLAYMFVNTGRKRQALDRVDEAVAEAERFGDVSLLSRALGLRVVLQFMAGDGVDAARLQRALALDDGDSGVPVPFQPRIQHALLMAWTGELDIASDELRAIESRRLEAGQESESVFISFHRAMLEIWRGDFAEARRIADATMDKNEHLDGDVALFSALTINSTLASYAGSVDEARESARVALAASQRAEGRELGGWLLANIGFLEVSLGNYEAALNVLQPVIDGLFDDPDYSEIIVASSVSDAVEAMVALGRLDDAGRLTDLVERNGNRLDRPWMCAVGGRCRGMVLAAQGDITAGGLAAERAIEQHERIRMPFERARTQLLLGQLRRRQRQKQSAAAALSEAVATFERLNTPLWADRARTELSRVTVRSGGAVLSPSEWRVAELVASGKTNRAIAAELFISPKTVDTNLGRIYRKLGIHSRAELAHWVSDNRR